MTGPKVTVYRFVRLKNRNRIVMACLEAYTVVTINGLRVVKAICSMHDYGKSIANGYSPISDVSRFEYTDADRASAEVFLDKFTSPYSQDVKLQPALSAQMADQLRKMLGHRTPTGQQELLFS